jgi:two-component system NtrC family response regulator
VDGGDFRSDLFYRLNVIPLKVPALRERSGDIQHLIRHFMESSEGIPHREFTSEALEALQEYSWPGNVRELENLVERLCVMSTSDVIDLTDLPGYILSREDPGTSDGEAVASFPEAGSGIAPATLKEMEKAWILYVLEHRAGGQKRKAAKLLGINESTLHRKLDRYLGEDSR